MPPAAILQEADVQNHPGPLFNTLKANAIADGRMALTFGLAEKPVVTDITDSTTGTSDGTIKAVTIPAAYTTAGTDCAPKAAFDTATGKIDDAMEALATEINKARAKLLLPLIVFTGTPATSATMPALDKALAAVTGTTVCIDQTTGRAVLTGLRNNLATFGVALNEVMAACGRAAIVDNSGGTASATLTLYEPVATAAGNDGTALQTLSDTAVDAALTAIADSLAGLAVKFNAAGGTDVMIRASLTDSSTGTVRTALPSMPVVGKFTVTATDAAQKTSFDTMTAAAWNGAKALAEHVNMARRVLDLPLVVYSGAPATYGTIPSQTKAVTASDGSGNAAVEGVTARTQIDVMRNNMATLARATYEVLSAVGASVRPIDNSGGNKATGFALTANVATGTGVDGLASTTVSKAAVDVVATAYADGLATLASALNSAFGKSVSAENYAKVVYVG